MIYPTLRRLAKNGLVSKKMVVQAGRPNKNLYSITVAGKKEFEASLTTPTLPDTRRSDFLMRLYFGEYEKPADLTGIMQEQVDWLKAQIDKLQGRLQGWPNITPPQKLSFTIGIAEYEAQLKVLHHALAVRKNPAKEAGY